MLKFYNFFFYLCQCDMRPSILHSHLIGAVIMEPKHRKLNDRTFPASALSGSSRGALQVHAFAVLTTLPLHLLNVRGSGTWTCITWS